MLYNFVKDSLFDLKGDELTLVPEAGLAPDQVSLAELLFPLKLRLVGEKQTAPDHVGLADPGLRPSLV